MDSTFSTRTVWAAETQIVAVALVTPLIGRRAAASHRIPDYQP
jgi:hypothetical protein